MFFKKYQYRFLNLLLLVTAEAKSQPAVEGNIGSFQLGKNYLSLVDIRSMDNKGEVKGSRFFPSLWTTGFLIDINGNKIFNPAYCFIYDKLAQKVYLRQQAQKDSVVVEIDNNQLYAFALRDADSIVHYFQKDPVLSNTPKRQLFFEVLYNKDSVMLMKHVYTKFIRVNQKDRHAGELREEKQDEYRDEIFYYYLSPGKDYRQVKLTKRSVENVFGKENTIAFFTGNDGKKIDEKNLLEIVSSIMVK